MDSVKTTVDIPEDELAEAMRHSRARTKKEAVGAAVAEYNRRRRLEALAERLGKSGDFMTAAQLRRLRGDEHRL